MNRLASEKSPYLLKHADNPVDWYPWCEEAFLKAKQEDKPIFLSIGYSSCHWCNVMEKESFEDPEIARMLNDSFVCIKVDREERPDIDNLYMTYCQMMTGSGGWPLTIIMTPDKKPFFAATYIPKESKYNMPGLKELIPTINQLWRDKSKRGELIAQGERLIHNVKVYFEKKPAGKVTIEDAEACFEQLLSIFDEEHGGFGTAPKFPSPLNLIFLLRYYRIRGEKAALIMAEKTLTAIRRGGIFDQLGYGVHRYSTDSYWMIPHFEKMLYDQALCIIAYLEAYEATGKAFYLHTAEEIIEYVMNNLRGEEGGFYTSEDADSEGEEGKFYLWKDEELRNVLNEEEYRLVNQIYLGSMKVQVDDRGFILHLAEDPSYLYEGSSEELRDKIEEVRKKLLSVREKRERPALDDKILTDWNGLMIAALSKAYSVTGKHPYLESAKMAADFILKKMKQKDGSLLHRYRDGEAKIEGFLEDYAYLSLGLIELYEASFDTEYLKEAIRLKEYAKENFWDKERGGFYQTKSADLSNRIIEVQDSATPSGNSVMAYVIYLLSRITGDLNDINYIEAMKESFSHLVKSYPMQCTSFLLATCLLPVEFREIVVACNQKTMKDAEVMLREIRKKYIPNKVLIIRKVNENGAADIDSISNFVSSYGLKDGLATVYVCKNFSCQLPATTIEMLKNILG